MDKLRYYFAVNAIFHVHFFTKELKIIIHIFSTFIERIMYRVAVYYF